MNTHESCSSARKKPTLTVKAEVYLPIGWYRGNASRPFVVDRGFFNLKRLYGIKKLIIVIGVM